MSKKIKQKQFAKEAFNLSEGAAHVDTQNDENLCKTQVSGVAATLPPLSSSLPKGARGEKNISSIEGRGSKGVGDNLPSSGTMCHLLPHRGEGIKEMLKRVQHDMFNFLKRTYSLINLFTYSLRKRAAFTLAEVLITLGIIGVVAAMTMPVLVANHRKSVVETRLQKFYSVMNQAIIQSEIENGDKSTWNINMEVDGDFNDVADNLEWYNKYLAKYLKTLKVEKNSDNYVIVYFPDGSAVIIRRGGSTYNFFPEAKHLGNLTKDDIFDNQNNPDNPLAYGKNNFFFAFYPNSDNEKWKFHKDKGLEPYKWINGSVDNISWRKTSYGCSETGSKVYCTALIQENGWKIPKDYPIRF